MTAHKAGDPTTLNRLYGRSSGHKLRPAQQQLIDTLLPTIAVPADSAIGSRQLFGDDRPLHLEIGFGSGEHLAARADLLPDHGFIGCEPFINGVAATLAHIRDRHLANVRIWRGDALDVLRRVPDGALSFVYLLHPDPWPKARHSKRRMINDGPLELIAAKLRPGGELRVATDHPTYLECANARAHRPVIRLAGIGAVDVGVDQRLADQRAENRVAFPVREQVTGIDDHPGWSDRRVPPQLGSGEFRAGRVIRNRASAVMAAVGNDRPSVVAAPLDQVQLVAALRAHFRRPQATVRSERESQDVAVAHRVELGRDPAAAGGRAR